MKKIYLSLSLLLALTSCAINNENINTTNPKDVVVTPSADINAGNSGGNSTTPSFDINTESTAKPTASGTKLPNFAHDDKPNDKNKELRALIDKDIKKSNLLVGLDKMSIDKAKRQILTAIDGMIQSSIYYSDNYGIRFKSGARIKTSALWASSYYHDMRYVTGSKLTIDIYHNDLRYSGIYLSDKFYSDFDSKYVETKFNEAGYGLYGAKGDTGYFDDPYNELINIKSIVEGYLPTLSYDDNNWVLKFSNDVDFNFLYIKENKIEYKRYIYNLDIINEIRDINICLNNIDFIKHEGDKPIEMSNPLALDERAKNALYDKLGIDKESY